MERLAAASAGSGRQLPGDADALGARVAILHNKWRTVWRLSVDRKKLLQDTFDHLLEVYQRFGILLPRRYAICVSSLKETCCVQFLFSRSFFLELLQAR